MKKTLFFLLILCFASSHVFSDGDSKLVLNHVRRLYTITDDRLINFEGKVFGKLSFKSLLHENLSYKLKDPGCADSIYNAYEPHILPTLNTDSIASFERALLQVCQLLGIAKSRSEKALLKALAEEGFPIDEWLKGHRLAFNQFLHELHPRTVDKQGMKLRGPLKIVLITTSTSGGNLSVATAVKAYLDRFGELFETTVIDYETFASRCDPIKIATGKYTVDNIFRLLQQQNQVDELLIEKDMMCREVAKYIPNRTAEEMKAAIKSLNPHLIISTRNYYPDDFNLLSLNIPFRMLYCDHEICFFHQDYVGKIDPELVKFWLPSSSPRFFKPLFEHFHQGSLYQRSDDWQTLMGKISQITHSQYNEIQDLFEIIGFPVRLEFKQIKEIEILEHFKHKWDLQPDEKGLLVEMGANGVGILENIFYLLASSSVHSIPIKYFFVCGRNEELRKMLTQAMEENKRQFSALKRCAVLGYVEAKEKNELMNICSLMISKPGGSTQAEVTKMRLPMFIMHIQKICEEGNKERLFEDNLAYDYDPHQSLTVQIEEVLRKIESISVDPTVPKWKKLLLEKLQEFRQSQIDLLPDE